MVDLAQATSLEAARLRIGNAAMAPRRSVLARVLRQVLYFIIAAGAYVAHQHFKLAGASGPALASLVVAAGFALAPVRAVLHALLELERGALHLVHGIGGLAFIALSLAGVFSAGPLLSHTALAPFEIMGAAQAVMHQNHPRNAAQAAALRQFASALPEVQQFTRSGSLSSPENLQRAVSVLSDLLSKAQVLGSTELQADPGFQSALRETTARLGVNLGLDSADQLIRKLATHPGAAAELPQLRRQLAQARKALATRRAPTNTIDARENSQ
jgi:hypothetical protein